MNQPDKQETSTFLSILDTWPEYYQTMDEGLGTTYERFILHRYFEKICQQQEVNSVLEVPSFGMTGLSGINSLWWGSQGIRPMIADTNQERIKLAKDIWNSIPLPANFSYLEDLHQLPFGNKTYDLSWNFASLWFVKNMEKFITELDRVTQKVIFICVPNRNGIGYLLRSFFNKEQVDGFYPENINPKKFVPLLKAKNWQVMDSGYLDIPPWPDIAMKKEDMASKVGLGFLFKKNESQPQSSQRTCIVDYFSGKRPQLEEEILKYDMLENIFFPVKQLWGHHRYFIFVKS